MAVLTTYYISIHAYGEVDESSLNQEIKASGMVDNPRDIEIEGDAIRILGDAVLDEAGLDNIIANHDAHPLAVCKSDRCAEVDLKTTTLIEAGFVYDSTTFSLSANAQLNWMALKTFEDMFSWPVEISNKAGGGYSLEKTVRDDFIYTGKNVVQGHLDTGRHLKILISEAVDKAALNAVIDTR